MWKGDDELYKISVVVNEILQTQINEMQKAMISIDTTQMAKHFRNLATFILSKIIM